MTAVSEMPPEVAAHHTQIRPLFLADWIDAVFVHFAVEPADLQPQIPFELDLFDGRAYLSLVAFTQRKLRPCFGGRLTQWLSGPIAEHEFLNVRTYVRVHGEPAIHFIVEWIPNRLAIILGPPTYGLPYRFGQIEYRAGVEGDEFEGDVTADGRLSYRAMIPGDAPMEPAAPESLDEFLLERYTAFTCCRGVARRFRIHHAPWPQAPLELRLTEDSLLQNSGVWPRSTRFIGASFSPGVHDVLIGWPQRIRAWRICSGN
jgi:uncharacterized protein YqjF (DUF2071 family)